MLNNVNKFKIIVLIFFAFLISCHQSSRSTITDDIIPEIKTVDGGVIPGSEDKNNEPYYFTPKNKSYILINEPVSLSLNANRYMEINGVLKNSAAVLKYYRSVIAEVESQGIKDYYTLPVDNNSRFTGYIYFKNKGVNNIHIFLFYDYISYEGLKVNTSKNIPTTASLYFKVDVFDAVPERLFYLLPTKNVNCGNRLVRDISKELTKDVKVTSDKAKKLYEYIIFGNTKARRLSFISCRTYKNTYNDYPKNNYHNTFIASEILQMKRGICNDFAEVYIALARAAGIKVKKIWGYSDESKKTGHMWVLLNLEGDEKIWHKIDPSWGSVDRENYKKWADLYPEFNDNYFENGFLPYSHKSFSYEQKIEY